MAAATTHRDRTAPAWLERVTAAGCLLGAEAIHVAVMDHHFDEWLLAGLFFLAISLAEGMLAVALLVRPSRTVSRLAVGVSLATVALWLVSRTIGLEAGPAPGVEPFGRADSIASLLELLTAVALLGPAADPTSTPRSASDYRRAALVISTVAALTVLGASPGASEHAGHSHPAAGASGQVPPNPTAGRGA
jgi:hypothetical protein